ncbi:hypothetical protein RhiirB3_439348 [Rhizophagus irregularis]|nr:hypothetical protein RhiirB3_439348 [Rhizophagus irregularis]
MTCSKIFSGDLPELTNEIIQYFRKDSSTLYSCILVNRLWCRLAIPLLWEDPFSIPTQHYHCIKTYLCFLNEDDKAKFNEYGINDNLFISNTLFNYPSFIKYLDTIKIYNSIQNWVITLVDKCNHKLRNKLGNLVYRSLLEVFIENEGNLYSLKVVLSTSYLHKYFDDNLDLILQNPNLTYNIRGLIFDNRFNSFRCVFQNTIPFLKFLYSNCNLISTFCFEFPEKLLTNNSLIENYLSQIIISQHNLKEISFGYFINLYNPFLSLKNSNCSNTLNTIIFNNIDFKNLINILQKVFDQLNVLESIHLIDCHSLNSDFVQQIIKVNKPFKLISLFMIEILHIESLQLLLMKFGDCIENFGFGNRNSGEEYGVIIPEKQQLFEYVMKYCKKINYFDSGIPADDNNIYLIIKNNQHNINYLIIELDVDMYIIYDELSSTILQNLGQVLPSKLEYLCLSLSFRTNDLEIFLKNSQNTFIKKLLIENIVPDKDENILFCIKKYIMKEERVKYLAILQSGPNSYNMDIIDLYLSEDEVNEYKLHNIIVQPYDDLCIDSYIFINNNYLQYYDL